MSTAVPELQTDKTRSSRELREIPFDVVSVNSSKLRQVPVTTGLCVPKGTLFDADEWVVEGLGGAHFPAQTKVLNRWSDGSVRWLLMHFVAGRILPGRTSCALVAYKQPPTAATSSVRWVEGAIAARLSHAGEDTTVQILPELTAEDGRRLELKSTDVRQESSGSVRCVWVIDAHVPDMPFVKLQFRLDVWPTAGHVKVDTRIRNTRRAQHKGSLWDLGDAGSFLFDGLQLKVSFPAVDETATVRWKAEADQPVRTADDAAGVKIVQFGSGSENWDSTNHVDASGNSPIANRGYLAWSNGDTLRGLRSQPVVSLVGEDRTLSVSVLEFWQQFPGSLKATATAAAEIEVGLFPSGVAGTFELQGGEQKTHSAWISIRSATHTLDHLTWTDQPPRVVQSTAWIRRCGVVAWLPDSTNETQFADYVTAATTGTRSFAARRDSIDEYGWRNFGDVPADHEQTFYAGQNTIVSHYNNQFDLIFGGILNLMTTGDPKWFDLFDPLARHVMDIDIYHTTEDRSVYNGGLFWHTDHYVDANTATHRTYSKKNDTTGNYGGGLSAEHNYTTGLMYYHFLTGSTEAYDSVLSLADWVLGMEDGSKTVFSLLDSDCTGMASWTLFEDFHGPGRGVGNSINALVDAWTLTTDEIYLHKAEQLIRRVAHPQQNCDELHLIDAEGHWSYTVCMTAMGRYLATKLEAGQRDEHYEYARQSLANYGRWMVAHERPTLSEPDKVDYVTEAWAAQDFRKANALRIAASCCEDTDAEIQMRRKADELNDTAWADLYTFGEQHLTARCLSILMTEGLRDVFHRTNRPEYFPPADVTLPDSTWTMFVPQKQRFKLLLKNPVRLAVASIKVLNPKRWLNALTALKRQI